MCDFIRTTIAVCLVLLTTACGGGGGSSGGGSSGGGDTGGPTTVNKSFTVSVDIIAATRVSNGDVVEIDTANLSQTGTLSATQ